MRIIIDRFEGDKARVEAENGKLYDMPAELLPSSNEGDVVDIIINKEETEKRREIASNLLHKLFKK